MSVMILYLRRLFAVLIIPALLVDPSFALGGKSQPTFPKSISGPLSIEALSQAGYSFVGLLRSHRLVRLTVIGGWLTAFYAKAATVGSDAGRVFVEYANGDGDGRAGDAILQLAKKKLSETDLHHSGLDGALWGPDGYAAHVAKLVKENHALPSGHSIPWVGDRVYLSDLGISPDIQNKLIETIPSPVASPIVSPHNAPAHVSSSGWDGFSDALNSLGQSIHAHSWEIGLTLLIGSIVGFFVWTYLKQSKVAPRQSLGLGLLAGVSISALIYSVLDFANLSKRMIVNVFMAFGAVGGIVVRYLGSPPNWIYFHPTNKRSVSTKIPHIYLLGRGNMKNKNPQLSDDLRFQDRAFAASTDDGEVLLTVIADGMSGVGGARGVGGKGSEIVVKASRLVWRGLSLPVIYNHPILVQALMRVLMVLILARMAWTALSHFSHLGTTVALVLKTPTHLFSLGIGDSEISFVRADGSIELQKYRKGGLRTDSWNLLSLFDRMTVVGLKTDLLEDQRKKGLSLIVLHSDGVKKGWQDPVENQAWASLPVSDFSEKLLQSAQGSSNGSDDVVIAVMSVGPPVKVTPVVLEEDKPSDGVAVTSGEPKLVVVQKGPKGQLETLLMKTKALGEKVALTLIDPLTIIRLTSEYQRVKLIASVLNGIVPRETRNVIDTIGQQLERMNDEINHFSLVQDTLLELLDVVRNESPMKETFIKHIENVLESLLAAYPVAGLDPIFVPLIQEIESRLTRDYNRFPHLPPREQRFFALSA